MTGDMTWNAETPPGGTIRDWVDARKDDPRPAFVFPRGDAALTWADLRSEARGIAQALTALGMSKGESVAIMMPNGREAILALFGVLYGGFRATMINLAAGPDAIAYALDHSDARCAFVGIDQLPLFDTTRPKGMSVMSISIRADGALHDISPSDHALLMYTSGTTGRPKGVVHTHSSLLAGGWTSAVAHDLGQNDCGMCVLPIYHINGLCVSVMSALIAGGTVAMVPRFSTREFWQDCGRVNATWFSAVPTIISHLLHSELTPDEATRARLRFARSASAPLSPDVQSAFEARFEVPIVETMGLTETAAQILSNPLPPGTRKIGSPGIAYGNEATVRDGEIIVRGPNVMLEYLKNPTATEDTFTKDGWLRTGDLGRIDEDGYLFVTGRIKELIIKGGENIAPREIDEALYAHPDVIEAAAFACPCPTYGERVEAAVTLSAGSSLANETLVALCVDKLGKFKSPDRVHILDDLPKGPSGKIQRLKLFEMMAEKV